MLDYDDQVSHVPGRIGETQRLARNRPASSGERRISTASWMLIDHGVGNYHQLTTVIQTRCRLHVPARCLWFRVMRTDQPAARWILSSSAIQTIQCAHPDLQWKPPESNTVHLNIGWHKHPRHRRLQGRRPMPTVGIGRRPV